MQGADPYDDLPDDPEDAFLHLERSFLEQCEYCVNRAGENDPIREYYVEYISKVIAAVTELGINKEFSGREVPCISDVDYNVYIDFKREVEHYKTTLKIRRARRKKGYSVSFDEMTKRKLNHHLLQIRETINKIQIMDDEKRDALFKRIEDLQLEIDKDRTRFEALAALSIEASGVMGEVVEKSRVLDIMDAISKIFWKSKQSEPKALARPVELKKISPPKKRSEEVDLDDEIPF